MSKFSKCPQNKAGFTIKLSSVIFEFGIVEQLAYIESSKKYKIIFFSE